MLRKISLQRIFVTLILCFYVHSCYDYVLVHSIYYASMRKPCHLTAILSHGKILSKDWLLCWIFQAYEHYILSLWQSRKHKIYPFSRDNNIDIYLSNTSPVSSLFVNPINEPIRSLMLQEHRQRNEEVSCRNNYSLWLHTLTCLLNFIVRVVESILTTHSLIEPIFH